MRRFVYDGILKIKKGLFEMKVYIQPGFLKFAELSHDEEINVRDLCKAHGIDLEHSENYPEYWYANGNMEELYFLLYIVSKNYDIDLI